jgi:putative endonuclease
MFVVYIIYSTKLNRYYVGTTNNINKRLLEHNTGFYEESYTVRGIPWVLVLSYSCKSSDKAYKLEKFIKNMKSRKFIERIIDDFLILDDICDKL